MDIELIVLSYLGYNFGRYLSSFAFCIFSACIWGLPALVVYLAGTIEAGRSPNRKEGRRGLPRANVMVVLPWLSPGIAPGDILDINLTLLLFLGIVGLIFSFLEVYFVFSLAVRARSVSFGLISSLVLARLYIFVCTIYFCFGIGSGLPIGSFCISK